MEQNNISANEGLARLQKLKNLKARGINPYPAKSSKTNSAKRVMEDFDKLSATKKAIQLAGRIKTLRVHGGLAFLTNEDETGTMQIALQRKNLKDYDLFTNNLDMGDFVEAKGELFLTHKGEKTLDAKSFRLLAKALLPMPEKWHGLSDTEIRYRQRYLDLIANPSVRQTFRSRGAITKS